MGNDCFFGTTTPETMGEKMLVSYGLTFKFQTVYENLKPHNLTHKSFRSHIPLYLIHRYLLNHYKQ